MQDVVIVSTARTGIGKAFRGALNSTQSATLGGHVVGHRFGVSGSRLTDPLLIEGRRRKVRYGVVSMCIAGGMGAAALFEIA